MAEGVGFEPTMRRKPHSGFQDRRHRPLGEPSRQANDTGNCSSGLYVGLLAAAEATPLIRQSHVPQQAFAVALKPAAHPPMRGQVPGGIGPACLDHALRR